MLYGLSLYGLSLVANYGLSLYGLSLDGLSLYGLSLYALCSGLRLARASKVFFLHNEANKVHNKRSRRIEGQSRGLTSEVSGVNIITPTTMGAHCSVMLHCDASRSPLHHGDVSEQPL